ncbi:hypothetical protein [Herbaspirillum robiniae]|uniref:hypothetical protein n=1 Tax=Herbaspirillum robiniae TaxID=2014887 RepID=UPI003D76B843
MIAKTFAAAALVAISGQAMAEVTPTFTLGTEVYEETYREWVGGKRFMKERASMKAVTGDLHLAFDRENAMRIAGRYAWGTSDYTGGSPGMDYGSLTDSGQTRRAYDIRTTYEWTSFAMRYPLTTSAGLGYRNLVDRLDQTGEGGYRRESEYFYATVGIGSSIKVGDGSWTFSPKASYQHLLRGFQHSGDDVNVQTKGYGLELSTALSRPVGTGSVSITPFYRYWKIADSKMNSAAGIMEPENQTHEFGVRLSYRF